jgi:hypothetical protein
VGLICDRRTFASGWLVEVERQEHIVGGGAVARRYTTRAYAPGRAEPAAALARVKFARAGEATAQELDGWVLRALAAAQDGRAPAS